MSYHDSWTVSVDSEGRVKEMKEKVDGVEFEIYREDGPVNTYIAERVTDSNERYVLRVPEDQARNPDKISSMLERKRKNQETSNSEHFGVEELE